MLKGIQKPSKRLVGLLDICHQNQSKQLRNRRIIVVGGPQKSSNVVMI